MNNLETYGRRSCISSGLPSHIIKILTSIVAEYPLYFNIIERLMEAIKGDYESI